MVYTFMEGIDPAQQQSIERHLSALFDEYPNHILEDIEGVVALDEKQKRRLLRRMKRSSKTLYEDWLRRSERYRDREHVMPVVTMASALAKDELATMAETLVSLTSFKRRVTPGVETVGGAIDVAVISKGDGFVWIRRKHYFPRELNHQFFYNYPREVADAEAQ